MSDNGPTYVPATSQLRMLYVAALAMGATADIPMMGYEAAAVDPHSRRSKHRERGPAVEPWKSNRTCRNAPCHCGSGKKYKKCCYPKPATPNTATSGKE